MRLQVVLVKACCLLFLLLTTGVTALTKVAIIGTTGKLGRETIQLLSQQGIATRCLLRHDLSTVSKTTTPPSATLEHESSSSLSSTQVAAALQQLPGVEMVQGDIRDPDSLARLIQGTSACLALHGPVAPRPFFRALLLPSIFFPEDKDPLHPKQLNYVGIQHLLQAMRADSSACKHIVRITGKGEDPWSIFSILINALGGIAKGWNYEGEQLIRTAASEDDTLRYTIIRPGILRQALKNENTLTTPVLAVRDNGGDLPVSAVTYTQIAKLIAETLQRPNLQRSTLTAMNSVDEDSSTAYTLDNVQPDSRVFPTSLLAQHKKAARVGGLSIMLVTVLLAKLVAWIVERIFF